MKSTLLLVDSDETTIMHVSLTFAASVLRFASVELARAGRDGQFCRTRHVPVHGGLMQQILWGDMGLIDEALEQNRPWQWYDGQPAIRWSCQRCPASVETRGTLAGY